MHVPSHTTTHSLRYLSVLPFPFLNKREGLCQNRSQWRALGIVVLLLTSGTSPLSGYSTSELLLRDLRSLHQLLSCQTWQRNAARYHTLEGFYKKMSYVGRQHVKEMWGVWLPSQLSIFVRKLWRRSSRDYSAYRNQFQGLISISSANIPRMLEVQ